MGTPCQGDGMNLDDLPKTQIEAIRYFADADKCHDFLVEMRWPNGVTCPHCESLNVGNVSSGTRKVWNCRNCKKQFSAKVKTIFEASPLGLDKWLPAVWLITNAKNGVSSCELARALGITQKSAWHMGHRIRMAMKAGNFEKLSGEVESDESYIGGKSINMHAVRRKQAIGHRRGGAGKAVIHALLERGNDGKVSRVHAAVVPNAQKSTLKPILTASIESGSTLYTDTALPYLKMDADQFVHQMVDHAEKYVEGRCHTNSLENFWSLLKRTLKGTYVSVDPIHLERYLDEQVTRFNERKCDDRTRFFSTMQRVAKRRLTYKKLTGGVDAP